MKTDEYTTEINGNIISFYHNKKTHKMEILSGFDYPNPYTVTLAKGRAIVDFLKFLETNKDMS